MNDNASASEKLLIVTFLGRDDKLDEVEYCLVEDQCVQSNRLVVALSEWYPDAQVVALVTEETEPQIPQLEERVGRKVRPVIIPSATNEKDYWVIYSKLSSALLGNAKDGEKVEVIFDITNGFRSLPFIGLLALEFLQSANEISIKHIYYGARDDSPDDQVPVYDLEPFQSMLEWSEATTRFLETGDARKLVKVMRHDGSLPPQLIGNESALAKLHELADSLSEFSENIFLQMTFKAGQSAAKAVSNIEGIESLGAEIGPIGLLLDKIKTSLQPLAFKGKKDEDREIVRALLNMIFWYRQYGYIEKSFSLFSEWIFMACRFFSNLPLLDKSKCKYAEDLEIYDAEHLKDNGDVSLCKIFKTIRGSRNTTAHMGIPFINQKYSKPISYKRGIEILDGQLSTLRKLAEKRNLGLDNSLVSANPK